MLIVDTVGFAPGVLSPPILNSDKLHVVERFSLDPDKMLLTRSYSAEDPVVLQGTVRGLGRDWRRGSACTSRTRARRWDSSTTRKKRRSSRVCQKVTFAASPRIISR